MKERLILFFIFINTIFLLGCTSQLENIEELPTEEVQVEIQEHPSEEFKEEPSVLEEKEPEFEFIYPKLTYNEAYNGPLYATSEQVGSTNMDDYFKLLDRNGINFFIGMFPIFGKPTEDSLVSHQDLGHIIDAAQKHPKRIIPFFNPGIGGEDISQFVGAKLTRWYKDTLTSSKIIVGDNFIRGFGEVETQEWNIPHNDQKVKQLIDLAERNNISFMFHPIASKIEDIEGIVEAYPNTIFLIHMYREDLAKSKNKLIDILKKNNNLYYSIDAAHIVHIDGDVIYELDSPNKESSIKKFISYYDSNEKAFVDKAIKDYKPLVDAVPDKVMWGTEIGPAYAFDKQVFDRAIKASRLVIAGFDKEHQEAVGYKNALRVFGEGAVINNDTKIINTRSWPECGSDEEDNLENGINNEVDEDCADKCEEGIENPDYSPETQDCLLRCDILEQCRDIPEQDIG